MKRLMCFVALFVVGACAPTNTITEPTPFTTTTQKVIVVGCEQLRQEVEDWNKSNPTDQRVADC